jgi:hypothetical protein
MKMDREVGLLKRLLVVPNTAPNCEETGKN